MGHIRNILIVTNADRRGTYIIIDDNSKKMMLLLDFFLKMLVLNSKVLEELVDMVILERQKWFFLKMKNLFIIIMILFNN